MTVRKQLIELLDNATETFRFDAWENSDKIADYLIANGVTFAKDTPVVPGHDNCHDIAEMAYNNGYDKGCEDSKPKWIPVSERLPKHCETVLSYDGRHYRQVKTDFYDSCFECWYSDMKNLLEENTVTHWMPLPEPPKEE